jgi:Protein of unknown function (DUF2559)
LSGYVFSKQKTRKETIMQITINVPDTLPQERLRQRIQELEQSLITEAKFFALFAKQQTALNQKSDYFEQHKYENFVHSSRLENINIVPVNNSMSEIIEKYKRLAQTSYVG